MKTAEDNIDLDLRLILKGSMLGTLKKRNYQILSTNLRRHHGSLRHSPNSFIDRMFSMFDFDNDGCIRKEEFKNTLGFIIL